MSLPSFVDPEVVVEKLLQNSSNYQVVDVRGDNSGGNIVGALNIPDDHFDSKLDEVYEQLKDTPELYFHCQLSQVRGPTCARKYSDYLTKTGKEGSQKVYIIQGGFQNFGEKFSQDKRLVENKN
jgi:Cdc25 family phosphatase